MGSTYKPGSIFEANTFKAIAADDTTAAITLDGSNGNITLTGTVDGIDIATDVPANTAKVSADGLVTTHSDVTSAGSGIIITAGERTAIGTNTTNNTGTVAVHSDVTAGQATAIGNLSGTNTGDDPPTHQVLTDGTTITWDQSLGANATLTLTDAVGTRTLNITNDVVGQSFLILIQDSTDGLELIATWDSSIKWTVGIDPTLSEGLSEEDVVVLFSDGTTQYGFTGYDYQ